MRQAEKEDRNLILSYIVYKKAFHSVPHSWLLKILQIYKIDSVIQNGTMILYLQTEKLKVKHKNGYQAGAYTKKTLLAPYGSVSISNLCHAP